MKQWNILFFIGAAVYVFGGLVFLLGVNSNVESWGRAPDIPDYSKPDTLETTTEKSKCDYEKSSNTNQVNIDINNNEAQNGKSSNCRKNGGNSAH